MIALKSFQEKQENMKKLFFLIILGVSLAGCAHASLDSRPVLPASAVVVPTSAPQASLSPKVPLQSQASLQPTATATLLPVATGSASGTIPNFDHIVLIVLENEYLQNVIGSAQMPGFNALAGKYVLLSNYFAISHPSLPNYLALVSGSTQNITSNCTDCFVNSPNLADEIEASGRTWKSYLESMPSPCFVGNKSPYAQMGNPFLYFDSIRLDPARCKRSIVPLTQLDKDLAAGQMPNFAFIMPNLCNSGHDCAAATADGWLKAMVAKLQASSALGQNSLIIITFDEGVKKDASIRTRGQVATLLISPLAHPAFIDPAAYSHYSLLKTILAAWKLPDLGETGKNSTQMIQAPWLLQAVSAAPGK